MPRKNKRRGAFTRQYIAHLIETLKGLPLAHLSKVLKVLESAYGQERQIFLIGNGGSAATASHMANDLMKGVAKSGAHGFRAIALADNVAMITAIANDEDYTRIFSSQLEELADAGDILIIFSGSGNSANIVQALKTARNLKMTSIAFLGMGGGRARKMADVSVVVPSSEYGPIEDAHMMFDHLITAYFCDSVRRKKRMS
jgi:D-sedoheptulose 7-phosphate isomerase